MRVRTLTSSVPAAVWQLWAFRAVGEGAASERYRSIARRLDKTGAPAEFSARVRRAAADELRHEQLCRQLVRELGGADAEPRSALATPTRSESSPVGEVVSQDSVLSEVVATCCVAETLNVALLTEGIARCRHDRIRAALREVLRDEVQHSQLGWSHLAHASRTRSLRFLADQIPTFLDGAWNAIDGDTPAENHLGEFGNLDPLEHRAICHAVVEDVIVRGLETYGVSGAATREWLRQR